MKQYLEYVSSSVSSLSENEAESEKMVTLYEFMLDYNDSNRFSVDSDESGTHLLQLLLLFYDRHSDLKDNRIREILASRGAPLDAFTANLLLSADLLCDQFA